MENQYKSLFFYQSMYNSLSSNKYHREDATKSDNRKNEIQEKCEKSEKKTTMEKI